MRARSMSPISRRFARCCWRASWPRSSSDAQVFFWRAPRVTAPWASCSELASYWAHRAFHRVPFLWRFHAIHHSVEQLDWLAGSRLHVVDVVLTRLAGFLPVFVIGFAPEAVYGYLMFVSFHAVYIHANVNHRWPVLRTSSRRRSFTTGTMLPSRRQSTRISPCCSRAWTRCSGRRSGRGNGRNGTARSNRRCREAIGGRWSFLSAGVRSRRHPRYFTHRARRWSSRPCEIPAKANVETGELGCVALHIVGGVPWT